MRIDRNHCFQLPLFSDLSIQTELRKKGFAIRKLIELSCINQLRLGFEEMMRLIGQLPDEFCPSGRLSSVEARNLARKTIDAVVPSALRSEFQTNAAVFEGGTYLIKPSGPHTALNPHQDSSHVDEQRYFSVYAWIPLEDTNIENGCLHVIPESHLLGNRHRSLNVPWAFAGFEDELWKKMVPLEMRLGEVCFFEGATIHASPPNTTDKTRVAINYFIRPSESSFLHFYRDEQTPEGQVERYQLSIDYFYNEDFEARPPKKFFAGFESDPYSAFGKEEIRSIVSSIR